ncbi:hypothetical protein Taro_042560 [Colocasia esculenta]|uniref:Uncharacterized protein n=1 Tax=Colocasia esculenta TaxID=4460 RepID=A0A843WZT6_COLES|nr:hypothetical protein [Colocasia esculenta]
MNNGFMSHIHIDFSCLLLSLEKKWAAFLPEKEKKTSWGVGWCSVLGGTVPLISEKTYSPPL